MKGTNHTEHLTDPGLLQTVRRGSQAGRPSKISAVAIDCFEADPRFAQTALDYVLSHPTLEKTKIFLYGQSIGGAVAIFLAERNSARVSCV